MQLAESMASSTEAAWLRQSLHTNSRETSHEKKLKNPKPSPAQPQPDHSFRTPPAVVDLDQSGSEEDSQQHPSNEVIDLTVDVSPPRQESESAAAVVADTSVGELMDESMVPSEHSTSPLQVIEDDDDDDNNAQLNRTSHYEKDPDVPTPLQSRRVSVLQRSNADFKAETSGTELESFNGNFNLQLDDSDNDVLDDAEEEEQKLLSHFQRNGSFDVNKSLLESRHQLTNNGCPDVEESIVATKKKRAAVIYDSEEEEEQQELRTQLDDSFQVLGASTPKSLPSASRKSVGGNASVVSRRSFLQSIIEDAGDQQDTEEEEEARDDNDDGDGDGDASERHSEAENAEEEERQADIGSSEEGEVDEDDSSGKHSEAEEEEDIIFLTWNEPQPEETIGETLNTEEEEEEEKEEGEEEEGENDSVNFIDKSEEDKKFILEVKDEHNDADVSVLHSDEAEEEEEEEEEDDDISSPQSMIKLECEKEKETDEESDSAGVKSEEDSSSNLEESSSDPELASGERLDQCTAESESYDSLVRRGKECYSQAKLDDALSFFLRAIDIKSGDPEVQFMTIQLYRQLSQRR